MREENIGVNFDDYSDTVRYLEQFQEPSKTTLHALQPSEAGIYEDVSCKALRPGAHFRGASSRGLDMYGTDSENGFHSNHAQSTDFVNETRERALALKMRGFAGYDSFNQAGIGANATDGPMPLERNSSMFNYHYTHHNTQAGMPTCTPNSYERLTKQYPHVIGNGFLSSPLQNCSPSGNINPLAGLSELAEKASFASELVRSGATQSGFSSRGSRGQINRPGRPYEIPRDRNWPNATSRNNHGPNSGRQANFQRGGHFSTTTSVLANTAALCSPQHSTGSSRQGFSFNGSDSELTPPSESTQSFAFDRPPALGSRSYANYRLWSTQTDSITPNVTVVPDPRGKLSQFFKPGSRTKSEQILEEHLETFGKFLSPQNEKIEEKAAQPENKGQETKKKEKKPATIPNAKETAVSEEDNTADAVFPCKWLGCDGLYSEQDDLVRHIEKVHIDQRKADDLYICYWEDCSRQTKPFNARYKLVIHMRVHSGEKPNKCTVSTRH